MPPLYVWRIRSRVYRWYGQLRAVEQQLAQAVDGEGRTALCDALLKRLDEIEAGVNQVSIPLAFADSLYGLRNHINFVRQRVRAVAAAGAAAPAEAFLERVALPAVSKGLIVAVPCRYPGVNAVCSATRQRQCVFPPC